MLVSTDIQMLQIVVYSFSGVIIAALIAFAVVGSIAFSKINQGAGKSFGLLFFRGEFLRMATVILCIFSVVILSFGGKLTDGAIALLSGIIGFVLGGAIRGNSSNPLSKKSEYE